MYRTLILTLMISLFLGVAAQAAPGEKVPAGEKAAIDQVSKILQAQVRAVAKASGHAERDAHPKAHACVRGTFQVNKALRSEHRHGVFQEGATYPTWIRFSNGSQKDDTAKDARGIAIKLMDVPGAKLSRTEQNTQDFLMINHPIFFVRNAADYVEFSQAVANGGPLGFFFPSAKPWKWRIKEARIARTIQGKKVADLTQTRYWSMTPYLMGQTPAKFSVKPCFVGRDRKWNTSSANFLSENLQTRLDEGQACFEFLVQMQTREKSQPVEDPTVEWREKHSPFVKVGTLTIDAQRFGGDAQKEFCENLSFNPWHSVPEHQPLGGINRVRREVYRTISQLRHDLNKEPLVEPTGKETFN